MQLRRITTSGTWIPEIDGLRFMAIAGVILFHVLGETMNRSGWQVLVAPRYGLLVRALGNGDRGVPLFFVISGYILAKQFLRQHLLGGRRTSLRSYFLRRITRLEPPYVLSLLLYTGALMVVPGPSFRVQLPHLVASMFYVHSLAFGTMSTINFVTWSLEIEIQFYLVAPLIGLVYCMPDNLVRRGIFIAGILFCGAFHLFAHGLWLSTVFNYGHFFLAGFLMADLMATEAGKLRRFRAWDGVSLVGWVSLFLLPRVDATLQWLPFLILPVYLAAFYGRVSNWLFRRKWIALTGGMCYSFYLLHMLTISVAFRLTRRLVRSGDFLANFLPQVLLLGACVYAVGTLYFVAVERPCMDPEWPQRLWRGMTGTRASLKAPTAPL